MKKLLSLFGFIFLFTSCSRESESNPSEPIQTSTKKFIKKLIISPSYSYNYEYANQKLSSIIIQNGNIKTSVEIGYNSQNELDKLNFNSPSTIYTTSFTYQQSKLMSLKKQIVGESNPLVADFTYDTSGKLSKISVKYSSGMTSIASITYEGNIMNVNYNGSNDAFVYTFDNKNSPYLNIDKNIMLTAFVVGTVESSLENLILEHNMIKEVHKNQTLMQYQYEYETDGFPTKQIDVLNNEVFLYEYVNL